MLAVLRSLENISKENNGHREVQPLLGAYHRSKTTLIGPSTAFSHQNVFSVAGFMILTTRLNSQVTCIST